VVIHRRRGAGGRSRDEAKDQKKKMRRSILRLKERVVSVLPIPMHLGQPHAGTDLSPAMLQTFGLFDVLKETGWRAVKSENLCDPSQYYSQPSREDNLLNAHNCDKIGQACQLIEQKVYQHAITENFLLIIGGDHSIPIGTLPAITRARPNTGVVWVDAHADINTPKTSGSGNIHGMVSVISK
jgi:arginase